MIAALGAGPEFDRIRAIAESLGGRASGLGDDCALIPIGSEYLAVSTDISVEGVHFRKDWLTLEEIGWRAAAGALSDLAAVGAEPVGVLTSLALPFKSPPSDAVALMEGIAQAVDAVEGKVLGGDLAGGPVLTIDVTVIGRTVTPVRRSGARIGDGIWVTGSLGGSRAALLAFERGNEPGPELRGAFAHPQARIAAGKWLAREGAHAMIDLSDGLVGDASHLAAASEVLVVVELERIPLGTGVNEAAALSGEDPLHFGARGGEDYELLVALPPEFSTRQASRLESDVGLRLTRIGQVHSGTGARFTHSGRSVKLRGYDHFA